MALPGNPGLGEAGAVCGGGVAPDGDEVWFGGWDGGAGIV
jgi:hypothetical protein